MVYEEVTALDVLAIYIIDANPKVQIGWCGMGPAGVGSS